MNEKLKNLAGSLAGLVFFALFLAAEILGITRAFHKGPGNGIAAIFIPPYAWYNAVAVLWEPAAWKEDWDLKTRRLATVIIATPKDNLENQVELADQLERLHQWVKTIPAKNREELRVETQKFGKEWIAYTDALSSAILHNTEVPVHTQRSELRAVPSFEKVFVEATKQAGTHIPTMLRHKTVTGIPQEELAKNLAEFHEIASHEIKRRTDEIFSEK